jgi:hypothetical protein
MVHPIPGCLLPSVSRLHHKLTLDDEALEYLPLNLRPLHDLEACDNEHPVMEHNIAEEREFSIALL